MFNSFIEFALPIFKTISILILIVAYLVWLERKVAAKMQSRVGPYSVGYPHGWLQPLADALNQNDGQHRFDSLLSKMFAMKNIK